MSKSIAALPDADQIAIATQAVAAIGVLPASFGATAFQVSALDSALAAATTALTIATQKSAESIAATADKDAKIKAMSDLVRTLRDQAKTKPVTDAQMASTGIPVGEPTIGDLASVPVGVVDTSVRQRHTISWTDAGTPGKKARPHNAKGVEIWRKIDGPPPTDVSQCGFVVLDSASPYEISYTGEEGGKIVHYMIRWALKDGTYSGWGDTVSATVTA